jgi:hypothetical protein
MIRRWCVGAALALLTISGISCGGSEVTAPPPEQVTGTWHATQVEYASTGTLGSVDLVAGGGSGTLVVRADGTLRLTVTPAGADSVVTTGSWAMTAQVFSVTPTGLAWSWSWAMTLSAGTLSLTGANAEYDFNHDGVDEPAKWNMVFTR